MGDRSQRSTACCVSVWQWLCSLSSVSSFPLCSFFGLCLCICARVCLNQNGLELAILLLPPLQCWNCRPVQSHRAGGGGGGGQTQAHQHACRHSASRATFPVLLFFPSQSENAAGVRKSGPLPSAEVQCHGCCVTYGRGGDHSP